MPQKIDSRIATPKASGAVMVKRCGKSAPPSVVTPKGTANPTRSKANRVAFEMAVRYAISRELPAPVPPGSRKRQEVTLAPDKWSPPVVITPLTAGTEPGLPPTPLFCYISASVKALYFSNCAGVSALNDKAVTSDGQAIPHTAL